MHKEYGFSAMETLRMSMRELNDWLAALTEDTETEEPEVWENVD